MFYNKSIQMLLKNKSRKNLSIYAHRCLNVQLVNIQKIMLTFKWRKCSVAKIINFEFGRIDG